MRKHLELKAWLLLILFISEIFSPMHLMALGSGPSQPEMATFTPAGTTEMVDPFTGDFSYNIPLMDVEGYPVNIAYNSGITMEQEASWVGLGWNLNVGTVNRSVRGLPDDFKGEEVQTTTNLKEMIITKFGVGVGLELFGKKKVRKGDKVVKKKADRLVKTNLNLDLNFVRNNYKGFGIELGTSLVPSLGIPHKKDSKLKFNLKGSGGFNLSTLDGASVNSSLGVSVVSKNAEGKGGRIGINGSNGYNTRTGQKYLSLGTSAGYTVERSVDDKDYNGNSAMGTNATYLPIGIESYTPYPSVEMESETESMSATVGGEFFGSNSHVRVNGSKTTQRIANKIVNKPAFGYNYTEEASENDLKDFNREKRVDLNNTTQNLSPISFTYDVYNVSGQGVSGMFRPFRNDLGMLNEPALGKKRNSQSSELGVEYGMGAYFHGGVDVTQNTAISEYGPWKGGAHSAYQFKGNEVDNPYEKVYFKAAGDLAESDLEQFEAVGGTDAVAFKLNKMATESQLLKSDGTGIPVFAKQYKNTRKARAKQLSFFTAQEANEVHNNDLASYWGSFREAASGETYPDPCAPFVGIVDQNGQITLPQQSSPTDPLTVCSIPRIDANRKAHHIAEITQTNADGERYVFGIGAYNLTKVEESFATDHKQANDGVLINNPIVGESDYHQYDFFNTGQSVSFGRIMPNDHENTVNNKAGIDNYYSKMQVPAYAHSYLLTEKQSADYQDVTGDGVSADDVGNAWKFNYTRTSDNFGWRVPYSNYNFDEGFETNEKDQKASCTYGTKELWYTHSIESKNQIAEFIITPREDGIAAELEDGINFIRLDKTTGGRAIDFASNNAKRSYKLDKIVLYNKYDRIENGNAATPIKTIHFTYDYALCKGVENQEFRNKGKLTLRKIEITYGNNEQGRQNPYTFKYSGEDGVAGINPNYHPQHVDRWGNYKNPVINPDGMLNDQFPYVVQENANKDEWASAWSLREIYTPSGGKITVDYEADDYAYVQDKPSMQMFNITGTSPLSSTTGNQHTLYGNNRIYFKRPASVGTNLSPQDLKQLFFGKETQLDHMYFRFKTNIKKGDDADHKEYVSGYVTAIDMNYASDDQYIWVEVAGDRNPFTTTSWGFFRQNLFEVLYEQPNVDDTDLEAMVKGIRANLEDIKQMFTGVEKNLESGDVAKYITLNQSFIRLNNPTKNKIGGGSRVKRIELNDNWDLMASDGAPATYGQEYEYTTEDENGNTISSGVATYESMIGNDENPWRMPVPYIAQGAKGSIPAIEAFQETPFGESFFPGASIGYSKIKVTNIHLDKGRTANSITEHQFFTAKDFPVIVDYTNLDGSQKYDSPSRKPSMPVPFTNQSRVSKYAGSQGYSIVLNDMHGKAKQTETYALQDDPLNPGEKIKKIVGGMKYNYRYKTTTKGKELDNEVEVLSADGSIGKKLIGVEYDIAIGSESSFNEQSTITAMANLDVVESGAGVPYPIPMGYYTSVKDKQEVRTLVVNKVIQQYGLIESVETYTDQYATTVYNRLYDGHTGGVLLTESQDEHNKHEFQFTIPAYLTPELQRMGAAYENDQFVAKIVQEYEYGCQGAGNYHHEGHLKHGDQVVVSRFHSGSNGETEIAWVDMDYNSMLERKDPFVAVDDPCEKYWEITLEENVGDVPNSSQGTFAFDNPRFCNSNSGTNPSSFPFNTHRTMNKDAYVELYLPNESILDFMLNPTVDPANADLTASDATNHTYEFCHRYSTGTNVFGLDDYNLSKGFSTSNIHDLNTLFDVTALPIAAEYRGEIVANASSGDRGYVLRIDHDVVENTPKLKEIFQKSWEDNPFGISSMFLVKFTDSEANQTGYFVHSYKKGRTVGAYTNVTSGDVYRLSNPLRAIDNLSPNPPAITDCPNTYKLVDRNGNYINDLLEGDQIKVIRSGNRNQMAASEGLIVANENPLNIQNGKLVGLKSALEVEITQISAQQFSDTYTVEEEFNERNYNKFLIASDGKFKPTKTFRYNGTRHQNTDGVETAVDGYLVGAPPMWTPVDNCYLLLNSPIQIDAPEWLLQEEVVRFNEDGTSVQAKNSLDIHSTVMLNPVGNVEAVASNTTKQNIAVESFENYKRLSEDRTWTNPFGLLQTGTNQNHQIGNRTYQTTELSTPHEEILVKGVAHTGDYSIFLKGANPDGLGQIQYKEEPIRSLVNITQGNVVASPMQPVDLTGYPNAPINRSQMEIDFREQYPHPFAEFDNARGTKGMNRLTYSHTPPSTVVETSNQWNPEGGDYYFSVWVKEILPSNTPYKGVSPVVRVTSNGNPEKKYTIKTKEIDGWYQITGNFNYDGTSTLDITLDGGLWGAFFDDLRIHKTESNVQTYVYDMQSGRLKAKLDENNYSTFYDYNDEGILSQVRRETASGVLTVSESRQSRKNQ